MQPISTSLRSLAFAAFFCGLIPFAAAEGLRPAGYFVQGGIGDSRVWSATAGLTWPWSWKTNLLGSEVGGVTEAFISHWNAPSDSRRRGFTQVGLVPMFRFRLEQGRSPWFAEAGVGVSAMDHHFVTRDKQFSTSFNFVDIVGVGRSFDAGRQELGLRLQHVSNGGVRRPNPGQNFLQLRYSSVF